MRPHFARPVETQSFEVEVMGLLSRLAQVKLLLVTEERPPRAWGQAFQTHRKARRNRKATC
jgi:hypothetical protein